MPSHLDEMIASLEAKPGIEVPTELSEELFAALTGDDDDSNLTNFEKLLGEMRRHIDRAQTLESACESLRTMVKQLHEGGRQLACINQQLHTLLTPEQAATVKLTGINGCGCDFCTERKKHEENWCSLCAKVRMDPATKSWENLDICDSCEAQRPQKDPIMPTVFHTMTWMESPTAISMQLGLEGAIANRVDAERVRDALNTLAQEALIDKPTTGAEIRVGILEIEAPSPSNGAAAMHITCTNVDAVVDNIQQQIDAARAKRSGA